MNDAVARYRAASEAGDVAEDGRIQRIRPYLRPWLAVTLLALGLAPKVARHPERPPGTTPELRSTQAATASSELSTRFRPAALAR